MTGLDERLVALFDGRGVFWLALVVALGVGAAHAVAPGHGKTITAAYLLGTRGRYRDAVRLGVIVAVMHTVSVLVLALAWVGLSGAASLGTRTVTAWMQVAAGLLVIGVGAHLTWRHLRGHHHDHAHHHHDHRHDHRKVTAHAGTAGHAQPDTAGHPHGGTAGHHHGHPSGGATGHHHDHAVPTDPWSRRGLTALALSGGLLPSPSAFLVLVSGVLTGRAVDALVLVVAFGVGMAATLTGVGVVTIRGFALLTGRLRRWPATATAWLPAVAGVAVSIGGCLYLVAAISVLTA
ncbi:nickel/cobalt transporter [Micromonospora sp. LZ34]